MSVQPSGLMVRVVSLCALTMVVASGCQSSFFAHRVEKKTLNGLATAVQEKDAEKARELTSSQFSSSVLTDEEALEEVKRLWPVTGELQVTNVMEVAEGERKDPNVPERLVTVMDEREWETDYRLIKDPATEKWVVDEIMITATNRGISVTKTVSEQIAFQTVVKDFSDAWRHGNRDQRLALVTPSCRAELEGLPDQVLDHVAAKLFPPDERTMSTDETMDEDIAIVRLRHPTGMVLLQMKRLEGSWLIDDAAYEGGKDGETIPSLRRSAVAFAAATKFLTAYQANDLTQLEKTAQPNFYNSTLKHGDLASVSLPTAEQASSGQLRIVGGQGELVVEHAGNTYKIDLVQAVDEDDALQATQFRVQDVTIYGKDGSDKKQLTAALVAEPTARLFVDALVERDISQLRVLATQDFANRIWDRTTPDLMPYLPLDAFVQGEREILSQINKGDTTEVNFMQAGRAMTVIVNNEMGSVKIDDVLVAVADRPWSTKSTLAKCLPIAQVISALETGKLDELRKHCTNDFNRSIWSQIRDVPPVASEAVRFLDAPLASLQATETEATAHIGAKDYGGMVSLLQFDGEWKVSDITLIAGPQGGDRVAMKTMLRDHLANGTLYAKSDTLPNKDAKPSAAPSVNGEIRQVGFEEQSNAFAPQHETSTDSFLPPQDMNNPLPNDPEASSEPEPFPGKVAMEEDTLSEGDIDLATIPSSSEASDVKATATPESEEMGRADSIAAPFDAPLW